MAVRRLQLLPGERVLVDVRPHWAFLSGPLAVAAVVVAAGVALDVGIPHTSVRLHWVEGVGVAVPCFWLAVRAVRWRTTRLVLTQHRLVEEWGVARRRRWEVPLSLIASVAVVQPLWRRVLGTGRLEFQLWDDPERHAIDDVRKPAVLQRVINRRLQPEWGPTDEGYRPHW